MNASMSRIMLLDKLKQERDELARLERMVLAQRQKVVELERQADSNPWSHANLVARRPAGFYESQLPERRVDIPMPFTLPPKPPVCPITRGCWLEPGHVGHCD